MSVRMNKAFIAGNLTREPQTRVMTNGNTVCNFGMASSRKYRTGDGESKEDTLFIDVEAWGKTAELVVQYLSKGSGCLIEGRLKLDTWEDKEGNKRSAIRLVAENVQFTDARGAGHPQHSQSAASNAATIPPQASMDDDDQPPF